MRIFEAFGRLCLVVLLTLLAGAWSAADGAAIANATMPSLLQSAQADDPVAMVVRVTGTVNVRRAEGGEAEAAGPGMRLMAGDRLDVADGAQAVLLYVTGRRQTVVESLVITAPEQAERAGVFDRTVSTLNTVASTDARQHPNRQGMIRPIAGAPRPARPANGLAVLDLRPTLIWFGIPDVQEYVVQIRSEGGARRQYHTGSSDTTWTLPSSEPPLEPDRLYHWTVAPVGPGRIYGEATFRTLDADEYSRLVRGFAEMREADLDPAGDGMFLAALLFRDAGLFYEADRVLGELSRSHDTLGSSFYMLRGEVYDALGYLDEAEAAFARVDSR